MKSSAIVALADLTDGQEADFFALLSDKQPLTTRDGKPYFRVTFRDSRREVLFPIWNDSPLADACRDEWQVGGFYKLRAVYRETNFGPQLDIRLIRATEEADADDGFDPLMCQPRSRFPPDEMFDSLLALLEEHITDQPLHKLVSGIFERNRDDLLHWPAAQRNHHSYASGFIEHVLNVTRNAAHLAQQYATLYDELSPPLDVGMTVAGAALHDIGKLRELRCTPVGGEYTASGSLIGHILQGRDIVREAAAEVAGTDDELPTEQLLRLEHIIVSHQRLPEWGAPKPPMTPEALIVHYSDDLDAKLQMMVAALMTDASTNAMTSRRNPLGQAIYKGGE